MRHKFLLALVWCYVALPSPAAAEKLTIRFFTASGHALYETERAHLEGGVTIATLTDPPRLVWDSGLGESGGLELDLPVGLYSMRIDVRDFSPYEGLIRVEEEHRVVRVGLRIGRSGQTQPDSLQGVVLGASAGAWVKLTPFLSSDLLLRGVALNSGLDADGRFSIRGLVAGLWILQVVAPPEEGGGLRLLDTQLVRVARDTFVEVHIDE